MKHFNLDKLEVCELKPEELMCEGGAPGMIIGDLSVLRFYVHEFLTGLWDGIHEGYDDAEKNRGKLIYA